MLTKNENNLLELRALLEGCARLIESGDTNNATALLYMALDAVKKADN